MKRQVYLWACLAVGAALWSCGAAPHKRPKSAASATPNGGSGTVEASAEEAAGGANADPTSLHEASPDAADCGEGDDDERPYCCASDNGTFPHIQEAYCRVSCDDDGVYCIDGNGDPLDDSEPPRLVPGQQMTVRVLADSNQTPNSTFVLIGSESDTQASRRIGPKTTAAATPQPTRAGDGGTSGEGGAGGEAGGKNPAPAPAIVAQAATASGLLCTGSCEQFRLLSYTLKAPHGVETVSVRLVVTDNAAGSVLAQRRVEFVIDRGRFRYELGFVLPVTFGGQRRVSTAPLGGTSLQTLESTSDAAWAFGVGIIIYPFGVHDTIGEDPRPVLKYLAPIGFGLGTNLRSSHDAFTEAFLTLNYRFGYGAVLGVGISAIQGEYLRNNFAPGDVLPAGVPLGDVVDTRYMFRPNLTLTLSADVIRSFIDLVNHVDSTPSSSTTSKK